MGNRKKLNKGHQNTVKEEELILDVLQDGRMPIG
jgi:hypothetical protein